MASVDIRLLFKVLSKDTHSQVSMEEEIKRYTTLSYRAPEMIDLFSDVPIGMCSLKCSYSTTLAFQTRSPTSGH